MRRVGDAWSPQFACAMCSWLGGILSVLAFEVIRRVRWGVATQPKLVLGEHRSASPKGCNQSQVLLRVDPGPIQGVVVSPPDRWSLPRKRGKAGYWRTFDRLRRRR